MRSRCRPLRPIRTTTDAPTDAPRHPPGRQVRHMKINVIAGRADEPRAGSTTGHHAARVFDSDHVPADRDLVAPQLRDARHGPGGAGGRAAGLPPQVQMEMPSSIAVATAGTIRPTLTSSSVNCGMALIALDCDRPDQRGGRATSTAGCGSATRTRPTQPARPVLPRGRRRGHRGRRVRRRAVRGGPGRAGAGRGGRPDRPRAVGRQRPAASPRCRRSRGSWPGCGSARSGPSNHFVELQEVEEVLDPRRPSCSASGRGR